MRIISHFPSVQSEGAQAKPGPWGLEIGVQPLAADGPSLSIPDGAAWAEHVKPHGHHPAHTLAHDVPRTLLGLRQPLHLSVASVVKLDSVGQGFQRLAAGGHPGHGAGSRNGHHARLGVDVDGERGQVDEFHSLYPPLVQDHHSTLAMAAQEAKCIQIWSNVCSMWCVRE